MSKVKYKIISRYVSPDTTRYVILKNDVKVFQIFIVGLMSLLTFGVIGIGFYLLNKQEIKKDGYNSLFWIFVSSFYSLQDAENRINDLIQEDKNKSKFKPIEKYYEG